MDNLLMFSERLSELIQDADITTNHLGTNIGVDGSSIRQWTEKRNSISLGNAIKIADYFRCSLAYLFGRSEILLDFTLQPASPFYEQLTKIMTEKGLSRYRVRIDLGKSNTHFIKWKKGAQPLMETVIELADYLDVTLDSLAGRE